LRIIYLVIREVANLLLTKYYYSSLMITIILILFILIYLEYNDTYWMLMMLYIKSSPGMERCAYVYTYMYMCIWAMSLSTNNTCKYERKKNFPPTVRPIEIIISALGERDLIFIKMKPLIIGVGGKYYFLTRRSAT